METAKRRFSAILASGRTSHAYIVEGRDPESRKDAALLFANMVLCEGSGEGQTVPCGTCRSCQKVSQGLHPDLVIVAPQKGMIRIDAIKNVVSQLKFPPFEAKLRAILILDCDKMNLDAANTLLKTLEEPPPGNCFFLTCPSEESLLPTIRSRCQVLTLPSTAPPLYEGDLGAEGRFLELLKGLNLDDPDPQKIEWAIATKERLFELLGLYHLRGKRAMGMAWAFSIAKEVSKDRDYFTLLFFILKCITRDVLAIKSMEKEGMERLPLITSEGSQLLDHLAYKFHEVDLLDHLFRLEKLENMARRGINLEYASNSVLLFWFNGHE